MNATPSPQSKRRILVVDDEIALLDIIEKTLEGLGFSVTRASDGNAAKNLLTIEDFDIVLSDIRMPNLNGIELLHFIKRMKQTPVILMTGFSDMLDTKDALELGAKGFLPKPFKRLDLAELIESILKPLPELAATNVNIDDQFSRLRIEEFVTGKEISYDIYVRITESKYVKIASQGESIDIKRIDSYRQKNLHYLYLKKAEFRKYLGFTVDLAHKVAASDKIEHSRKLQYLTQSSIGLMKDLYLEDIDKGIFDMAVDIAASTIDVLGEDPEALNLFEALKRHTDHLYAHSLAVCLYSILIGKALAWNSPRTILRLAMCGMMHDVGKKEIAKEILEKSRIALTAEEVHLLETHPKRGMEILSRLAGLPEEVSLVAMQHHEDCQGLGYPLHLTKQRIMPLARLVALANEFCNHAFPSPGYAGTNAQEAIQRIQSGDTGRYDGEFLNALRSIFGQAKEKVS